MRLRVVFQFWLVWQLLVSPSLPAESNLASEKSQTLSGSNLKADSKIQEENRRIVHLLNRAGFGPRPGDVEKVRAMGVDKYLDLQLRPSKIDDSALQPRLAGLKTLNMSSAEIVKHYPPPRQNQKGIRDASRPAGANADPDARREMRSMGINGPRRVIGELSQAKVLRAVYSERQLYEVMVDFWMNHFNVFAAKGANRWLITSYDRDVIRPHAMGKFKDLLMATAKSPAMLFYLDNWLSTDPDADVFRLRDMFWNRDRFRSDNSPHRLGSGEDSNGDGAQSRRKTGQGQANRRRGLNENYARELMELHTLGVDGGYTQKDITEVARCLTGWTIARPRQGGDFVFFKLLHDDGEKTVLGERIPAHGGIRDGERVLEILVHHPSTAKFIATKLARRFVADEPAPSLIDRVARVFHQTGGDIPSMLRTIFTSQEFYATASYRAKVKTPFELVVSAVRAVGAETDGGFPLLRAVGEMGEPLFLCQPPTGYADTAEAWVNTGALLKRINFALALTNNRLPGTRVNLEDIASGAKGSETLLKRFGEVIVQGGVSDQTLSTLTKQINGSDSSGDEIRTEEQSLSRAKIAGLLLGSPEFQRQ